MGFNMRPKNLRYFAWGTVFLFGFLTLLFLAAHRVFVQWDPAMTIWVQTIIPRSWDVPLSFFSLIGNAEPTTLALGAIGLWILIRERRIYFPFVLFGALAVFEFIGKLILYHPGPPMDFFRYSLPFEIPHIYVKTVSSFPSGHVSRFMFLVVIGLFLASRLVKGVNKKYVVMGVLVLLSVLMVVSRVYLGEHWASDVIGGLFLGISMGLLALIYY